MQIQRLHRYMSRESGPQQTTYASFDTTLLSVALSHGSKLLPCLHPAAHVGMDGPARSCASNANAEQVLLVCDITFRMCGWNELSVKDSALASIHTYTRRLSEWLVLSGWLINRERKTIDLWCITSEKSFCLSHHVPHFSIPHTPPITYT